MWNISMKMLSYSGNALAMIVRAICGYQHENAHIAAMRSPTMAKLASRNWHGRLVLCRFFSLKPNRYCFGVVGIIRHSISACGWRRNECSPKFVLF